MSSIENHRNRLKKLNEDILKLVAQREDIYKQLGKDIFLEYLNYRSEKNKVKSFETIEGICLLFEHAIEEINNKVYSKNKEETRTEELLSRVEKRAEKNKQNEKEFIDKLNKQIKGGE